MAGLKAGLPSGSLARHVACCRREVRVVVPVNPGLATLEVGEWGGARFGPMKGSRCWRCYVGSTHRAVFRPTGERDEFEAIAIFSRGQEYDRVTC